MNIEERRQAILRLIMERSPIAVNDLLRQMGESPATIRRDLTFLEENGIITRTRGYARYVEPDVVHKIAISREETAIARRAAAMIADGETVLLDSGTATLALAQQLQHRQDLNVLTNSLAVANTLSTSSLSVHMTGGYLIGREEALVGPEAESYIRRMTIPRFFLTTTGIRGAEGLACVTPFQANINRAFLQSSRQTILLAESSKFRTDALRIFATFDEIDTIITSAPIANPALQRHLQDCGVEVIGAEADTL